MMDADLERYFRRRSELLDRVRKILITNLDIPREPDTIDPDTPLFGSGLGLDSVDAVELAVCLQSEFGLHLPDSIVGRSAMRTVNQLVDLILAHTEAAS